MSIGMVLGKFMPPHRGHQFLVSFAQHYVDTLYVIVGSLPHEPISGHQRWLWMKALYPMCRVLHLDKQLPQHPEEAHDFWAQWQEALTNILPEPVDFVFASESYGQELAQVLSADFVPLKRDVLPISGTKIRENPMKYWEYLPDRVRPYFLKRVCLVGPESSGKTTLAKALAHDYNTRHVPEYADYWLQTYTKKALTPEVMPKIARGQSAAETAMATHAHKLLFCDTDPLTTLAWARYLFENLDPHIEAGLTGHIKEHNYDLYIYCEPDIPWEYDVHRIDPESQKPFSVILKQVLHGHQRPFVCVKGSVKERIFQAKSFINGVFTP